MFSVRITNKTIHRKDVCLKYLFVQVITVKMNTFEGWLSSPPYYTEANGTVYKV